MTCDTYFFLMFVRPKLFRFLWYLCFYLHTLRDSISTVCRIEFFLFFLSGLIVDDPIKVSILCVQTKPVMHVARIPVMYVARIHVMYVSRIPVMYVARIPVIYVARKPVIYVARTPVIYLARIPVIYVARIPVMYVARIPGQLPPGACCRAAQAPRSCPRRCTRRPSSCRPPPR